MDFVRVYFSAQSSLTVPITVTLSAEWFSSHKVEGMEETQIEVQSSIQIERNRLSAWLAKDCNRVNFDAKDLREVLQHKCKTFNSFRVL